MVDGLADECGVTLTPLGGRTEDCSSAPLEWERVGASWLTPTRVMVATAPALSRARIVVATPVVLPVSLTRREPVFLPMITRSPSALLATALLADPAAPGLTTVFVKDSTLERPKG